MQRSTLFPRSPLFLLVAMLLLPAWAGAQQAATQPAPAAQASPSAAPAPTTTAPRPPMATRHLEIKYVRDSEEYAALTRQVYRIAGAALEQAVRAVGKKPWVVVMDIDESALDNSTYQMERAAYGLPFEIALWNAWVRREEAVPVPGAAEFAQLVHRLGGRIAWISNRLSEVQTETRRNLAAYHMWHDDDRMCFEEKDRPKQVRRAELLAGKGACSWDRKVEVLMFVGDQMGDFPSADENFPNTATDAAFGRTQFLLPNPMYGRWESSVTRPKPAKVTVQ